MNDNPAKYDLNPGSPQPCAQWSGESLLDMLERPFGDAAVRAVVLDRNGTILQANRSWKEFAATAGLRLPDAGVGQNYLQYCAFADEQSGRMIDGITQLLQGRADCLSFIYPCHWQDEKCWFLLLGFGYRQGEARALLLHVDVSRLMPAASGTSKRVVVSDEFGGEPINARLERMMESIERSIRAAAAPAPEFADHDEPAPAALAADKGFAAPVALSRRQRQVLELMAKGLSNIEIGRRLAISPNTVKIHVSGILARLGVPNRAQAIHWTLTRLHDEARPGR